MLALSTDAAPERSFAALLDGCQARGLAGLELVAGHRHGIDASLPPEMLEAAHDRAAGRGVPIIGFRAACGRAAPGRAFDRASARMAAMLDAPVLGTVGSDPDEAAGLDEAVRDYEDRGARLLLVHGSDPGVVRALRRCVERAPHVLGLAWEADPTDDGFASAIADVLDAAGDALAYVRLLGGGPESAQHEGRGIGPLAARLALMGYDGPLVLAPSARSTLPAWSLWLGRGGGWGCGSKAQDPSLVPLLAEAPGSGRST